MKVRVRVFALPQQVVRNATFEIKLQSPSTITDVLLALPISDREKKQVFKQTEAGIELAEGLAVLINGRNISLQQGLATYILDGDKVSLINALGGG